MPMFKFFNNIKNNNKVWQILTEKYFNGLNGRFGNTVIKISQDTLKGNLLLVKTDNSDVSRILQKKESEILVDIHKVTGILLSKIDFV